MQKISKFPVNMYSREHAFANVPKFNFPDEFIKKKPPVRRNPFKPFLPADSENLTPRQVLRHPLNVEGAMSGWIRALDRHYQRRASFHEANMFLKDRFKIRYSSDDLRTLTIPPKNNLYLLRDQPFVGDSTSHSEAFATTISRDRPARVVPQNSIDQPIGKFLLRERFGQPDSDEEEFRRRNIHPPVELVQFRQSVFDKEAKFAKAYKEWVAILSRGTDQQPLGPKPLQKRRRRRRERIQIDAPVEVFPLVRGEPARTEEQFPGVCYCQRNPINPRHQISPPHGVISTATHYNDHFGEKPQMKREPIPPKDCMSPPHGAVLSATHYHEHFPEKSQAKVDLIPPRDCMSPPHGAVLSATHYNDQFNDKGNNRRGYIIPPDGMSPPHGAVLSATNYNDQFFDKGNNCRGYIVPPEGMSPPHGKFVDETNYSCQYPDKPYSRRELIILPGGISPPHGAVSAATHYRDHFPEPSYSRREKIVLPGGISPPHGKLLANTSYARDFQECVQCRRGYIVPPEGMSPPHGQMSSGTAYSKQFQEKGLCCRGPINIPDEMSPPRGVLQEQTTYKQSYRSCGQCMLQHPPLEIVNSEFFGEFASPNAGNENAALSSPIEYNYRTPSYKQETMKQESDWKDIWDVEEFGLDEKTSAVALQRFDVQVGGRKEQRVKKAKSKRRKIKVVQRMASPSAPSRRILLTPPASPKPPAPIKRTFDTSYTKSYMAAAMRNLN